MFHESEESMMHANQYNKWMMHWPILYTYYIVVFDGLLDAFERKQYDIYHLNDSEFGMNMFQPKSQIRPRHCCCQSPSTLTVVICCPYPEFTKGFGLWIAGAHQRQWSHFRDLQVSFLLWSYRGSSRRAHFGGTKRSGQCAEIILTSWVQPLQDVAWQWPGASW